MALAVLALPLTHTQYLAQPLEVSCANRQAFRQLSCTMIAIQAGDIVARLASVAAKFRERDQM